MISFCEGTDAPELAAIHIVLHVLYVRCHGSVTAGRIRTRIPFDLGLKRIFHFLPGLRGAVYRVRVTKVFHS